MAKSPPTIPKRIWRFKEPIAYTTGGKTGSCIETEFKEIKKTYKKLLQLKEKNPKLFIILCWLNSEISLGINKDDVINLQKLDLLSPNEKIPKLVSTLLALIIELKNGQAHIKTLDDLLKEKLISQISNND